MVCEHCGSILPEGAVICDQCGAQVASAPKNEGLAARRQGRPDKPRGERAGGSMTSPDDMPLAMETVSASRRRPSAEGRVLSGQEAGRAPAAKARPMTRGRREKNRRAVRKHMVNWALVWTILAVLLLMAAAGTYVFLKLTDQGQLILARMGREANANAMWAYGQELLDQGYVDRSVEAFEKAYDLEPERDDIYDRLRQLADAYEAAGRASDAEKIYTTLYTDIAPDDVQVYREMVRLLESQGRQMELAAFLKLAYEKTGDSSFRRQREDLLPSTPTADQEAGARRSEQDVQLLSAEGYEIYFILGDEGTLPEDGTLYTKPIHLDEGTHIIRAVAVSSSLISDEMRIQYNISLPRPRAPVSSLAPDVYERRQRVWLKPVETEEEQLLEQKRIKTDQEKEMLAKLKDITIYYTVDSQTPTSNSPIFTGEPFYLPAGKSTLKAVAVNGYGKVSNVMERTYQIKIPFKHFFSETDNFNDFVILSTSLDAFVRKFGSAQEEKEIQDESVPGDAVLLTYSWGEARFYMTEKGYLLYSLETDSSSMTGPRRTKLGMSETEITELYRDMGQTYNQDGSRSIYYESQDKKYARMYHLDAVHDRIDYTYVRADNGVVTLSYYLENSKVVKMGIKARYD